MYHIKRQELKPIDYSQRRQLVNWFLKQYETDYHSGENILSDETPFPSWRGALISKFKNDARQCSYSRWWEVSEQITGVPLAPIGRLPRLTMVRNGRCHRRRNNDLYLKNSFQRV